MITVLSVRCSRHDPSSKAYRTSPPIGVMDDVGYRPGAEDEVGAGRARTVHHLVGVRHPRRPAGRVAGTERVGAVTLGWLSPVCRRGNLDSHQAFESADFPSQTGCKYERKPTTI